MIYDHSPSWSAKTGKIWSTISHDRDLIGEMIGDHDLICLTLLIYFLNFLIRAIKELKYFLCPNFIQSSYSGTTNISLLSSSTTFLQTSILSPIYKFCTKRCQETKVFLKEICHESHTFLTYFFLFVCFSSGRNEFWAPSGNRYESIGWRSTIRKWMERRWKWRYNGSKLMLIV